MCWEFLPSCLQKFITALAFTSCLWSPHRQPEVKYHLLGLSWHAHSLHKKGMSSPGGLRNISSPFKAPHKHTHSTDFYCKPFQSSLFASLTLQPRATVILKHLTLIFFFFNKMTMGEGCLHWGALESGQTNDTCCEWGFQDVSDRPEKCNLWASSSYCPLTLLLVSRLHRHTYLVARLLSFQGYHGIGEKEWQWLG